MDDNWLDAGLFNKMKWLKYVSHICLSSRSGERLLNPHFPQIADIVRRIAQYSHIDAFTNGLALREKLGRYRRQL